ncbi:MAG: glycosyltransferase family 39 protein [Acidobacteria bacterium]|nr:glycosyltransferase family 39 protein [Acidobacteriota bacterium]
MPKLRTTELVAVACWAVLARLALVGMAGPALYWDSGGYLRVAKRILEHGFPPPLGFRPPGYPLFIIATSWGGSFLGGTVIAQHLLGVGTSVLMYLILFRITRSRAAGLLGVLAFSMMPDVLFMEVTIYSETVAMCLVTSCAFLMVAPRVRSRLWAGWLLCGIVTALATWTRPITLVLIPVVAMAILTSEGWTGRQGKSLVARLPLPSAAVARCLGAFLLPVVLLNGGLMMWHGVTSGRCRLANGMGTSSLNYLGHPAIYKNLPPNLEWISQVYEKLEPDRARWLPYIPWGRAIKPLMEARRERGLPAADWDAAALDTTLRAVRARPAAYARIWLATLKAYWSSYRVQYGLWRTQNDVGRIGRTQVGPARGRAVSLLESMWQRLQPVVSLLCLLAFPVACLDRGRQPALRWMVGWLWVCVVGAALVNTAIEPAVGQFRYRMMWSPLILTLAIYSLTFMGGWLVKTGRALRARD